jgi:hypothetical protein
MMRGLREQEQQEGEIQQGWIQNSSREREKETGGNILET